MCCEGPQVSYGYEKLQRLNELGGRVSGLSWCAVDEEKAPGDRQTSYCFTEVSHPIMLNKIIFQINLISTGPVRGRGRNRYVSFDGEVLGETQLSRQASSGSFHSQLAIFWTLLPLGKINPLGNTLIRRVQNAHRGAVP